MHLATSFILCSILLQQTQGTLRRRRPQAKEVSPWDTAEQGGLKTSSLYTSSEGRSGTVDSVEKKIESKNSARKRPDAIELDLIEQGSPKQYRLESNPAKDKKQADVLIVLGIFAALLALFVQQCIRK
jgi:hypothetical protein